MRTTKSYLLEAALWSLAIVVIFGMYSCKKQYEPVVEFQSAEAVVTIEPAILENVGIQPDVSTPATAAVDAARLAPDMQPEANGGDSPNTAGNAVGKMQLSCPGGACSSGPSRPRLFRRFR